MSVSSPMSDANEYWIDGSPSESANAAFEVDAIVADDLRHNFDIQGIPWNTQMITRSRFRSNRISGLLASINSPPIEATVQQTPQRIIYDFNRFYIKLGCSFIHYQLRHLLSAPTKNTVFYARESTVSCWNPISRKRNTVIDFATLGTEEQPYQISTLHCDFQNLYVGGLSGELTVYNYNTNTMISNQKLSTDENSITNAIISYTSPSGVSQVVCGNNDQKVRFLSTETFQEIRAHELTSAVNYVASSPDGKLLCCCCDEKEVFIVDADTGAVVHRLEGHHDFSFGASFHPNGWNVATGNQDLTTRVWDLRFPSHSVHTISAIAGPIRTVSYSSDGASLIMGESCDFLHVYDASSDYKGCQIIDFFGEIPGYALTPEDELLYVGVMERSYGGLLELRRVRPQVSTGMYKY